MSPFSVLGLQQDATEQDVRRAYRTLALANHPDKVGSAGEEKMKQLNVAYEEIMSKKFYRVDSVVTDGQGSNSKSSKSNTNNRKNGSSNPSNQRPVDRGLTRLRAAHPSLIKSLQTYFNSTKAEKQHSQCAKMDIISQQFADMRLDLQDLVTNERPGTYSESCGIIGKMLHCIKRLKVLNSVSRRDAALKSRDLSFDRVVSDVGILGLFRAEDEELKVIRCRWLAHNAFSIGNLVCMYGDIWPDHCSCLARQG